MSTNSFFPKITLKNSPNCSILHFVPHILFSSNIRFSFTTKIRDPILNKPQQSTYELKKYVASTLAPLVGNTISYIKDSNQYIDLIKHKKLDPTDKILSFDFFHLFTNIPLDEVVQVVKEAIVPETTNLA